MHPSLSLRSAERGSAAVAATFLALALGGLSLALLHEGTATKQSLDRTKASFLAFEAAETGFTRSEEELSANKDTGEDGIGNLTGTIGGGTFTVTAVNDPVLTDRWTLTSKGKDALGVRTLEECVKVMASGAFVEGLFSHDDLTFDGVNRTDAYDSRLGTYALQATNVDASGTYAQLGGNVGSNAGFIDLHGSAITIRGDAIPGPLHTVNEMGNPVVTGDTAPRKYEKDLTPTSLADFQAANTTNNNGNWTRVGGSLSYNSTTKALTYQTAGVLTMPGGTYFFSSLTLKAGATIKFTGPAKIYVTGSMDMVGGTLINDGAPPDLMIFAHPYPVPSGTAPTSTNVKINGGSGSKWAMYGPEANLTIGGGSEIYGAAVAKSITINGNNYFHYDKALNDLLPQGASKIQRLYWRETTPPNR
jgi:hypothetical protein